MGETTLKGKRAQEISQVFKDSILQEQEQFIPILGKTSPGK